jgi:hypothetical protein
MPKRQINIRKWFFVGIPYLPSMYKALVVGWIHVHGTILVVEKF